MGKRAEKAVQYFMQGYNCAQSTFAAFADIYGIEEDVALKMTSPMGAGIGRSREVCGAVTSMALILGLAEGNTDPESQDAKEKIYEKTRKLLDEFKMENGSIICRELLGLQEAEKSARPQERTAQYYAERPCARLVEAAALILEKELE